MERHGLVVSDVERLPIHGGSLRLFVRHAQSAKQGPRVTALLAEEQGWGVTKLETYLSFRDKVVRLKEDLVSLLRRLKGEGKRIAAYGAAAKGSTLLNHFGIGRDLVDFVVDRSTHKQGRRMPGVKIPIVSPDSLTHSRVDFALLLTWNFADEILAQQAGFRAGGGKFIIPVPEVRIV
jgi:hypothetical protein